MKTVCILAAGKGTRMGRYASMVHKALLPLGTKAVISHIFDQFSHDSHFVIALGDRGKQVEEYCRLMHPNLHFTFVQVKKFEGPGAGPGRSLLECQPSIRGPFIFTACDTLITTPLPTEEGNWVGVTKVEDGIQWCTVDCEGKSSTVRALHYKSKSGPADAFTGIAHVRDTDIFWNSLLDAPGEEVQVVSALEALCTKGLTAIEIRWCDTGQESHYKEAAKKFDAALTFEGKQNDITYAHAGKVLKFIPDEALCERLYKRGKDLVGLCPEGLIRLGNFLACDFVTGELLSKNLTVKSCRAFLDWAQNKLWISQKAPSKDFARDEKLFYRDKTLHRLSMYIERFPNDEKICRINSLPCKPVVHLIEKMPLSFYGEGSASLFHGDLHADNILVREDGEYVLIDWRDSFGESTEIGDLYYDLAKFLHTLDLSVEVMRQKRWKLSESNDRIEVFHEQSTALKQCEGVFWDFVQANKYDSKRIRIIDALIFINMAPLYDDNMARYLYHLGRMKLQENIEACL